MTSLVDETVLFKCLDFDRVVREKLTTFPDLVGFYESKKLGVHVGQSLRHFMAHFGPGLHSCHLFSSLTESVAFFECWQPSDYRVAESMAKRGWFTPGKDAEDTLRHFSKSPLQGVPLSEVEDACLFVFHGFAFGYLFLFWPEDQLVAYPHNKEGFGFVAKKGTQGERTARLFLEKLESPHLNVEIVAAT